ncbi:hypothetical protein K435DRAFT_881357 [Dendrothele bispora CBS 962.96]|uniref:BRCT domain-containing protein n=1 Tax=Dendrothele bispora (strain CBS 962.96) TaxID=1314807 RepID=A0A4V4HAE9_DENBC|nr:hypothetical protein K435DRAFT_881357 [Dendrothele bispora CBS 962.96]
MRIGGFLIPQECAQRLTGIYGYDGDSRCRRRFELRKLVEEYGGIMEIVSYPKSTGRDEDNQYLIATRYDFFSLEEFLELGKDRDQAKVPQFTPGQNEEPARLILDSLDLPVTFVTCWKLDRYIQPKARMQIYAASQRRLKRSKPPSTDEEQPN